MTTTIPASGGKGFGKFTSYPVVRSDFPACGRFELAVVPEETDGAAKPGPCPRAL